MRGHRLLDDDGSSEDRPGHGPPARTGDVSGSRFQRMLLGTDGSVTRLLEAYADEPIEVVKLLQLLEPLTGADPDLALPPGSRVLRRRVLLRGSHTRVTWLSASATVAADRVDPAVLAGLLETDEPIGALLSENRIETFREILRVDQRPVGDCGAHFGVDEAAPAFVRTYRIVADGRPIMVITETFPAGRFRGTWP